MSAVGDNSFSYGNYSNEQLNEPHQININAIPPNTHRHLTSKSIPLSYSLYVSTTCNSHRFQFIGTIFARIVAYFFVQVQTSFWLWFMMWSFLVFRLIDSNVTFYSPFIANILMFRSEVAAATTGPKLAEKLKGYQEKENQKL